MRFPATEKKEMLSAKEESVFLPVWHRSPEGPWRAAL